MTDNDRELLEKAARAAGMNGYQFFDEPGEHPCMRSPAKQTHYGHGHSYWSPLTDDGDALRLAVKLNLKPVFHPALNQAIVRPYYASDDEWTENCEDHTDPYAATRRAIVRAAASMDKEKD